MRIRQSGSLIPRSSEETADGRDDNRRVEMTSDDSTVFASVRTTQMVRDFDPPLVRVVPEFNAEVGVRKWSLVIAQGEKELIRYGSRSGNRLEDVETEWRVDHTMIDSGLSPLTATLIVQESTGALATAGATLLSASGSVLRR